MSLPKSLKTDISSLHSSFKTWIRRFSGVATKYLNNYLSIDSIKNRYVEHI